MVGVAAETNSLARWWALIPALLLALVFLLDVTQPPDVVFSMLYVAPIVLTLGVGGPRATTIAFLVSSVATVAAAAFGVMPANPSAALTNRSLALLAQVLAAAVVIQQLELRGRVTRSDGAVGREAGAKRRHATGHLADLGALIAALPEALILFTPEGQVLEVNEAAMQLLGMTRAALEGRHWSSVVSVLNPCQRDGQPIAVVGAMVSWPARGPDTVELEVLLQHAVTAAPVRCALTAVLLRDGAGAVQGGMVVGRDVTALRAGEAQKEAFISMAVHELRAPLSTLRGYAQMARNSARASGMPAIGATMDKTIRQVDRLNQLVGDLLEMSRLQHSQATLQYTSVDAEALVHEVVEQQCMAAPARSIEVVVVAALPPVQADPQRLQQVLVNLLDNAIKYSPDGGPIQVTLRCEAGQLQVSVHDQGVGIPEAEQELIFQRFYRGRSGAHRFSGLGVGLYISSQIIERHGGRMWVRSEPGQGSAFNFALPLNAATSPPVAAAQHA